MSDTRLLSRHPADLLTEEHDLLASFVAAYEDLSPTQLREKKHLAELIEDEVGRHVGTEESLFYPVLLALKDPVIHDRVAEALAEHRQLETLAGDLRRAEAGAAADLIVNVLRSLVDRHVALEQKEIFPFTSRFERPTLTQLGLEIEERRMREDRL